MLGSNSLDPPSPPYIITIISNHLTIILRSLPPQSSIVDIANLETNFILFVPNCHNFNYIIILLVKKPLHNVQLHPLSPHVTFHNVLWGGWGVAEPYSPPPSHKNVMVW